MKKIVFDIETRNIFSDVGKADATLLDISLVGVYDYETDKYSSYLVEDLPKLWPLIEKADMLITFNGDHFDIPLLNKYYSGDLSKIRSLDILKEIRESLGRRIGLSKIAQGTLGKDKSGHGLEAVAWWKSGEIEKIRKYCLEDVKITKEVYEYALKNKKLKYTEDGKTAEFPIDTKEWELHEEASLTFTLPF
jgi:uncharacterized protein YprB with RNaseH-like and TPR domain